MRESATQTLRAKAAAARTAAPERLNAALRVRRVEQPGPASPLRLEACLGSSRSLDFQLEPGLSLCDAIARPLLQAGLTSAGVTLTKVRFHPVRYVIPAFSPDAHHAAYYSETFAPDAEVEIELANLTFGRRADGAFLHCHALWRDPAGQRRGGHVLPWDAIVSSPGQAAAFGTGQVDMVSEFDPETNFTLFRPSQLSAPQQDDSCLVARIRPNEDLIESIATLCRQHGMVRAAIRSGVGSTIGIVFDDGRVIQDRPTELLVLAGHIDQDEIDLTVALIDTHGNIHEGKPARGQNPVLICFELIMQRL